MTSDEDAGEDKIGETARAEGRDAARSREFLYRAQGRLRETNIVLPPDAAPLDQARPRQSALPRDRQRPRR
jgi:hypothetical protein